MKKIYLAGPDVFAPNSAVISHARKTLCEESGFEGLYPADNEANSSVGIYTANIRLLRSADFIIANMTPFRGPSADAGTIFEIGVAKGLNIPVAAYSDNSNWEYIYRIDICRYDYSRKEWRDTCENLIENFGLRDNLMLHYGVTVWRDDFVQCLEWCKNEI